MTKSDRAARVAARICDLIGFDEQENDGNGTVYVTREIIAKFIRREVKRAVEEEREACAQMVDERCERDDDGRIDTGRMWRNTERIGIAAVIRSRGKRP